MKFNPWIVASPLLMVVKFSDEQYSCKWREWAFLYVFACMYACMHVYDTLVSVLITDCRSLKKKCLRNTCILLFYYLQMIRYFWLDDLLCWQWNYSLEMSQLHHLLISIYFASVTGKLHQHTIPFILREMENLKDVQYFLCEM